VDTCTSNDLVRDRDGGCEAMGCIGKLFFVALSLFWIIIFLTMITSAPVLALVIGGVIVCFFREGLKTWWELLWS
jgi:hypothetical protein